MPFVAWERTTSASSMGPSWTQEAQNYKLQWFPTDTLSPPQLAAGWHPYPHGTYPYSNGDVYGQTGSDTGAGTSSFAQWFEAILNAGIPVIITEDGGQGGTSAASGEPHMSYMESWADTKFASYIRMGVDRTSAVWDHWHDQRLPNRLRVRTTADRFCRSKAQA
jgi:hypothetical protein